MFSFPENDEFIHRRRGLDTNKNIMFFNIVNNTRIMHALIHQIKNHMIPSMQPVIDKPSYMLGFSICPMQLPFFHDFVVESPCSRTFYNSLWGLSTPIVFSLLQDLIVTYSHLDIIVSIDFADCLLFLATEGLPFPLILFGTPIITLQKLIATENYLSWVDYIC